MLPELLVKVGRPCQRRFQRVCPLAARCHEIFRPSHVRRGGEAILNMAVLDQDQQEIPFEGGRHKAQARLRRNFLLPAMMTLQIYFVGYYAVVASLVGTADDFNHASHRHRNCFRFP
jgi:hypothetical protein